MMRPTQFFIVAASKALYHKQPTMFSYKQTRAGHVFEDTPKLSLVILKWELSLERIELDGFIFVLFFTILIIYLYLWVMTRIKCVATIKIVKKNIGLLSLQLWYESHSGFKDNGNKYSIQNTIKGKRSELFNLLVFRLTNRE